VNNPWPALAVAVVLIVLGASMVAAHVRSWRRQQRDPKLDEEDRQFYHRRYRRRVQISATFVVLGLLIGLGDALLPFQAKHPLPITFYVIGLLLLTGWVMLRGFADFWSTAARGKVELARMRQKRRDLERQVIEFKHRNPDDRKLDDPDAEYSPQ
jgi:hypothetical protein